jgi:transcriptional regulator with XRE-family HTH domain
MAVQNEAQISAIRLQKGVSDARDIGLVTQRKEYRMTNIVGEGIRRCRKDRGLTQIELAERTGLAQPSISDMERGKNWPHYSTLSRVADALGCKVEEFFADETDGRPKVPQLPDTPLALSSPEAIDAHLRELGELGELDALMDELKTERIALNRWLAKYRKAPQSERFARRADAEKAKQRRASVQLYRLAALDRHSKILDPRGAEFKTVKQIAIEAMEATDVVQAFVESVEARERIETAGESA